MAVPLRNTAAKGCWRLCTAALFVLSANGVIAAGPFPTGDLAVRIRKAMERGSIDRPLADLYWLYAVMAPERLPAEYRDGSRARNATRSDRSGPFRCGTPTVRRAYASLSAMPPELRLEAEDLLTVRRTVHQATRRVAGKESAGHILPNWIETENFSVEWAPGALTNEDGTSPPRDDDDSGIPDVAEQWASFFEASFGEMVAILAPDAGDPTSAVFGGTGVETFRIPILIRTIGSGVYGFTQPDAPTPVITVNNNLSFVPENDVGQETGDPLANIQAAMKITAAHELFHVVQFLYEPSFDQPDFEDDWWWETSSTWMEDEVFDEVNDYYQFFEGGSDGREPSETPDPLGWVEFVEEGLLASFSSPPSRLYGGVVFGKYLSEHVAGQPSMGEVWALIRGGLTASPALDEFARDKGFTESIGLPGLGGLYLGYAASNASLDTEYEEGIHFRADLLPIRGDTLDVVDEAEHLPSFLGSTYREGDGTGGALRLSLDGEPDTTWGLSLLVSRGQPDRVLALGALDSLGAPSLTLASFEVGESAREAVSFLDGEGRTVSFTVSADPPPATDTDPPTAVTGLNVVAVPGGLDLSWDPSVDNEAVAGYVARVTSTTALGVVFRSLFGPIVAVEIRELDVDTYDVEVFAYDTSGNEGPPATLEDVAVDEPATPTPTPIPPIEGQQIGPVEGDDGGGGGGSKGITGIPCFIQTLRH